MLRKSEKGVTLAVRAQPGARRSAITGIYGEGARGQLKIAVQAPPVEGRANQTLVVFLAAFFSLDRKAVELLSGELSRSKVFLLRGITLEQAEQALSSVPGLSFSPRAGSEED